MKNNPYETPESDLQAEVKFKRSIWWKIYFVIITILSFVGMFSYLSSENSGIAEYLQLVLLIVATVGMFGFVFMKKILFPKFWMNFFFVHILFGILYLFVTNVDLKQGLSNNEYYISMAIGFIFSIPAYYALFSYGRPQNRIWLNA